MKHEELVLTRFHWITNCGYLAKTVTVGMVFHL